MSSRGAALVDAIVALAVTAVVCLAAAEILIALPARNARWDESAEARQRLRVLDARVAGRITHATPIEVDVAGTRVRVPSLWPRRLGFWHADDVAHVTDAAITVLARADGHRELTLVSALGSTGGVVDVTSAAGCGTAAFCGLTVGDIVLAVSADNACALFRVQGVTPLLDLAALMSGGPGFATGAVLVPGVVTVVAFDPDEHAVRFYDGYRSDNVLVDEVEAVTFVLEPAAPPASDLAEWGGPFVDEAGHWRGSGALGDGPFVGSGPMTFDIDQLACGGVSASIVLTGAPGVATTWRTPQWH